MTDSSIARLLLLSIRARLDAEAQAGVAGLIRAGIDWEPLLDLARRHSLLPLLYDRLQAVGAGLVPAAVLGRLQSTYYTSLLRNQRLGGDLAEVVGALRGATVEPIVLKGGALAATHLERAVQRQPGNSQACRTLARLYGWLGQYEPAMDALGRAVELDGQDPLGRYGPWVPWLRQLQGESQKDRWEDLLWIYGYWQNRYPDRAESYVQIALVWDRHKGDLVRARQMLESGLEQGAEPRGLLVHYLSQLE